MHAQLTATHRAAESSEGRTRTSGIIPRLDLKDDRGLGNHNLAGGLLLLLVLLAALLEDLLVLSVLLLAEEIEVVILLLVTTSSGSGSAGGSSRGDTSGPASEGRSACARSL